MSSPPFYNEFIAALPHAPCLGNFAVNHNTGQFSDPRTEAAYLGFMAGLNSAMKKAQATSTAMTDEVRN